MNLRRESQEAGRTEQKTDLPGFLLAAYQQVLALLQDQELSTLDVPYFESFKMEAVTPEQAGLAAVSSHINPGAIYKLTLTLRPSTNIDTDALAAVISSGLRFYEVLSTAGVVELYVYCKRLTVTDPQTERDGYVRLAALGIPTLECIFPLDRAFEYDENLTVEGIDPKSLVITLIEKGLSPLTEYNRANLFMPDEQGNPSAGRQILAQIGRMHANFFTHGDLQIKNCGYLGQRTYIFDLEGSVDFRLAIENQERGFLKRNQALLLRFAHYRSGDIIAVFQDAVLEDLDRFMRSLVKEESFVSPKQKLELELARDSYLTLISTNPFLKQIKTKLAEVFMV